MEEEKDKQGTGLGVGALVTAIIAFLLAVVPCVGVIAILPAVIALVLAIVGLSRTRNNQGVLIGGLAVAVIALMISVSQIVVIGKVANHSDNWASEIEKVIKDVTSDIEKEFGDNEVTIRVDSGEETVEIKATTRKNELENKLDELEGTVDTVKPAEPEK
ncbi:MAG: hypothetical protein MUC30_04405 [Bacteroidales bacterium]|jgi:hypothetical protein|nr:hypothetical protein [Bacteroidales bacterium]